MSGGSKPLAVDLSDNKDITIKIKSFKITGDFIILPFINSTYLTLMIRNFIFKVCNFLVAVCICNCLYSVFGQDYKVEEVDVVDSKK